MSELFESGQIGTLKLKNRFVRSATYEAMAQADGACNARLTEYMTDLAKGETGLLITSHAYVAKEGQAGPGQLGIYSDEMTDGLKNMVDRVHENGSRIAAQLAHAGKRGIGKDAFAPLGPSDVFKEEAKIVSAMTDDDIKRTVTAFGDAAQRSVDAGFDAIQIHAAHSYLLSQFLSPFYNKRDDEYGGNIKNRARFLVQVYEEIRQRVGTSFPIMAKVNSEDFLDGGLTATEMISVCHMLEDLGIDAIEMSGGTMDSGKLFFSRPGTAKSEDREVYYRTTAKMFKDKLNIPLILVGGFLSYHIAEEVVASGLSDYVALSRPLIREPHLVKRWASGDHTKATCISCNKCFATLFSGEGLSCGAEKKAEE